MAQIVFGSKEAQIIWKRDARLRAAAAREARIEQARAIGNKREFTVYIEPQAQERSVVVEAYSAEEAENIAEEKHLELDEIVVGSREGG